MLVSERSQTTACGLSLAGIAGSNSTGGMDVSCECCVLSSRGLSYNLSVVQRSPTYFGVSVCVRYKPHKRGGHGPLWAVAPEGENVCPKGRQHTKVHDILTQKKKVASILCLENAISRVSVFRLLLVCFLDLICA
jgi:hypothetical protein